MAILDVPTYGFFLPGWSSNVMNEQWKQRRFMFVLSAKNLCRSWKQRRFMWNLRMWSSLAQEMYMSLRTRLLQRRRLRWFLIQARFHLYTIWEKLIAFWPCMQRRITEAPEGMKASDSETGLPVAQPIRTLAELSARTLLSSPLLEYLKSSVPLKVNPLSERPQLLVCHDYKGGYQEDKWVQGKEGMEGYILWHWHLVDVFVYFSHSLVTIPPPGWINAAHKHGVPVLGTFITEWAEGASVCRSLLATAENCCMFASRLAELAYELGFDGWLINIENKIDMKDIPRLHLFVQHLRQCMHSQSANAYVIWYDAVTEKGELNWQNCLNEENRFFFGDSDGLFTNYAWSEGMAQLSADAAGDRATDVYMGVDVFGRNTFGGGEFNCDIALKVARKAQVSAALFAPGWVYETNQPPSFEVASTRWWRRIEDCWPVARDNPIQLPFFTDFNRGCGTRVAVEGNEVATQPWFNLSCQSLQPILKVISQPESSLEVNMSYEAAYSGGSCLRISGSDDTLSLVQLYKSYISVKENRLHVSYSVQIDDHLHTCLALLISRENSRFLVLLVEEDVDVSPTLQNCVVNRSMVNVEGSSKWTVREHMLELGTCNINEMYAVAYSHDLDVQKLLSLVDQATSKLSDDTVGMQVSQFSMKESQFGHGVLLGHLRISTQLKHDRDLPEIIFEGCQPEWTQKSEAWKSISVTLRWGLVQRHVQNGGCQWVQYHVYVTKGEEPGAPVVVSRREPEYLGVAVIQAFCVQDLLIPSSCTMLHFHLQPQCACGLPGALSPACSVDISHTNFQRWSSDSDPSQPLIDSSV